MKDFENFALWKNTQNIVSECERIRRRASIHKNIAVGRGAQHNRGFKELSLDFVRGQRL